MNPIKQIGRFQIPIGSVVMIQRRTGFWAWFWPGYDVTLNVGLKLRLTNDEKVILDEEMELHAETLKVLGIVAHLQAVNRPA